VPHRIWTDGYPANGEVLTLWLMLFSTSDGLARLTSLLPLPLAGVATAGLARELGARRPWAVLAGLTVITLPIVIAKSDSTYVDNLVMALVATAWFFGIRGMRDLRPSRRRTLYFLAGAAIGLAAGTKLSGLVPLAIFGVAMVVASVLRHRMAEVRTSVGEILAVGAPAVLLGGFWYLQNILVHGNPVYPFSLGPFEGRGTVEELIVRPPPELAGLSHWAQVAVSWLADLDNITYRADMQVGGYGPGWPLLLALGVVGLVVLVRRRQYLPIAVLVIPAILGLAVTPMPFWLRYTLFVPVIVAALAALAVTQAPRLGRIAAPLVVVLCLGTLGIAHLTANFYPGEGERRPTIIGLLRLVTADEAERRDLVFWRVCSRFQDMPLDARVRTDGFSLLHLIAGPGVDRLLMLPLGPGGPAAQIELDGVRATHMALQNAANIAAAKAAPETFEWLGPVCRGVELFAVRT
jgi:MYXO-CTERM domain-containing protein